MTNRPLLRSTAFCVLTAICSTPAMAAETYIPPSNKVWETVPTISAAPPPVQQSELPNAIDYAKLKLTLGGRAFGQFDDNIYRAKNDKDSDWISVLNPGVAVKSDFERHGIEAFSELEAGFYATESRNNYTDYKAGVKAFYDITLTDKVTLEGAFAHEHSAIGALEDDTERTWKEPAKYNQTQTSLAFDGKRPDWMYSVQGYFDTFNYDNVTRRDGTISVQDDRDMKETGGSLQLGKLVVDTHTLYIKGEAKDRFYDKRVDSTVTFSRDSWGYLAALGMFNENEIFSYDVYAGFLRQDYKADILPSVSAPTLYANAVWNITDMDRATLSLDRAIKESTLTGVSAFLQTKLDLGYSHRFTDNFKAGLSGRYINNAFETNESLTSTDRRDDVIGTRIWTQYDVIKNVDVNLSYEYETRNSNVSTVEYNRQIIQTGVRVKY